MSAISCQEVVAQLLRLARGEVQAQFVQAVRRHMYPDARCWDDVWTGDVRFRVGDWLIDFFSDVGEVDYVARVQTPDGRVGIFDD